MQCPRYGRGATHGFICFRIPGHSLRAGLSTSTKIAGKPVPLHSAIAGVPTFPCGYLRAWKITVQLANSGLIAVFWVGLRLNSTEPVLYPNAPSNIGTLIQGANKYNKNNNI